MKNVEEWEELVMEEEENRVEGKDEIELSEEGFIEAGNFLEIVLEEVISFSELLGTVLANNTYHQNLPNTLLGRTIPPSPPNRNKELEILRKEILRLKNEIGKCSLPGPVPPNIHTAVLAGTVPPNNGLRSSSRRHRPKPDIVKRRGVEPQGENGKIWKLKRNMQKNV